MASSRAASTARFVVDRLVCDRPDLAARKLVRSKLDQCKGWHLKDLYAHYGCVNAIEFSSDGKLLVSGGDDRRVLMWHVDDIINDGPKPVNPTVMRAEHSSNIFCLTLNSSSSRIFSAGNDETVIVHDVETGGPLHYFLHEKPVYCISLEPGNDNVFCSASDDGRVLIFDIRREPAENNAIVLAASTGAFHGVMYNPVEPRLVATANAKQGLRLYDVRKPKEHLICYGGNLSESCMSVRFNQKGTHVLGLRRRREALIYPTHSEEVCVEFDNPGYYNSCTMKSCCFAGPNDEYVLSGSDDFNLYMWKVPDLMDNEPVVKKAQHVLSGHRSIVNQVRYNTAYNIIASSGVEKIIKLWSPTRFPGNCDDPLLLRKKRPRKMFTHEEYIGLVLQSGQFMSHDYSQHNTEEDPRMMAFFDSLVQREVEGWSTDEDGEKVSTDNESTASSSDNEHETFFMGFRSRSRRGSSQNAREGPENLNDAGEIDEDAEVDETNNLIARLIAKKRKKLMRSRTQQSKPGASKPSTTAATAVTNGHSTSTSTPSTSSATTASSSSSTPSATNGKLRCTCSHGAKRKAVATNTVGSSSDEEQPQQKKQVTFVDSKSEAETSSSTDGESKFPRMRSVSFQPDSGVELNGSSSSSQGQPASVESRFKKSDRRPNKREYRRRRRSSSEDSSDSE